MICAVFCDFFAGVLCRLPKSPHQPHSQDDPRIITGLPHHGQFILRSPPYKQRYTRILPETLRRPESALRRSQAEAQRGHRPHQRHEVSESCNGGFPEAPEEAGGSSDHLQRWPLDRTAGLRHGLRRWPHDLHLQEWQDHRRLTPGRKRAPDHHYW